MNVLERGCRRMAWIAGLAMAVCGVGLGIGAYDDRPAEQLRPAATAKPATAADLAALERTLGSLRPRGVFLTVDTVDNRLQVHRGRELLRELVCSTGTGSVLEDPVTGRRWVFETPRGVRTVLGKRRDPVWIRPDWSFIEEGADPPSRWNDRVDQNSLGDWALDLGDGYLIHGTLFQRYLGRSVTHGCIRLGDDDLEYVYRTTPVGASVLLY